MKRCFALLLLCVMLLSIAACGGQNGELPEKLVGRDNGEYSILFGDDNSYTLQINSYSISGAYSATKYTDNSIVVLCKADPAGINDGNSHLADEFYLFSSDAESWEYFGEEYYELMPGTMFAKAEDAKNYLPIEVCREYSTARTESIYRGGEIALTR